MVHNGLDDGKSGSNPEERRDNGPNFIGLTIKSSLTVTKGFCSAMSRTYILLRY